MRWLLTGPLVLHRTGNSPKTVPSRERHRLPVGPKGPARIDRAGPTLVVSPDPRQEVTVMKHPIGLLTLLAVLIGLLMAAGPIVFVILVMAAPLIVIVLAAARAIVGGAGSTPHRR